jgi:hypothetical protein
VAPRDHVFEWTALGYALLQQEQPAMSEQAKSDTKAQKPATHFDEPHEVVLDPSLSKAQKVKALDTLEQDARQLAQASSEGMTGGERTNLHEVLVAKEALGLPVAEAYEAVLQDLRSRQKRDQANDARDLLRQAIAALEALLATFAHPDADATGSRHRRRGDLVRVRPYSEPRLNLLFLADSGRWPEVETSCEL